MTAFFRFWGNPICVKPSCNERVDVDVDVFVDDCYYDWEEEEKRNDPLVMIGQQHHQIDWMAERVIGSGVGGWGGELVSAACYTSTNRPLTFRFRSPATG